MGRQIGAEKQHTGLKKTGKFWLCYTALFLVIFFIAFLPFLMNGKSFIWDTDGIKLHYAVLEYLGNYYREFFRNLFSGHFSIPFYDFSIDMGEDILSTLNFYGLGDPLLLLSALVPPARTELFYHVLVVLRIYLAGVSFAGYAKHRNLDGRAILAGALCYAFSGYVLYTAVRHPFFIAPMMYLPLILIGADRLIEKKKPWLMIGMIGLTALNGFYFLYMITCFLAVYIVICTLTRYPKNRVRELIGSVLRNVGAYAVGILCAGVIFLPALGGYFSSMRDTAQISMKNPILYEAGTYLEMLVSMAVPKDTWDYPGMTAIGLISAVLLFTGLGRKQTKLRWGMGIAVLFMLIPAGGYILNGFAYQSGRWMFLFTFVLALVITVMLPELLQRGNLLLTVWKQSSVLAKTALIVVGGLLLFAYGAVIWKGNWWAVSGLVFLGVMGLVLCLPFKEKHRYGLLLGAVCLQLMAGGFCVYQLEGYVKEFQPAGTAHTFLSETPMSLLPAGNKNDFYRTDAAWKPTENAAMVTGQYGTAGYFSIANSNLVSYMQEMQVADVYDIPFKINGMDNRTAMMELANVKYFAASEAESQAVPYGYEKTEEKVLGDARCGIYENKLALPFGYTYDSYITKENYDRLTDLGKQEAALQCALLEDGDGGENGGETLSRAMEQLKEAEPLLTARKVETAVTDCENLTYENGTITVKKKEGYLVLTFASPADCEIYLEMNALKIPDGSAVRSCYITVYGGGLETETAVVSKTWNWYNGREDYLFNLGYHKDSLTTCKIVFSRAGTYEIGNLAVYAQPMKNYEKQTKALSREALTDYGIGTNQITGTVTVSEPKLLCFSIPYADGWSASVDGKEAERLRVNGIYTGLLLEPGTHEIRLTYRTPWLLAGIFASLLGFFIVIQIQIWYKMQKKDFRSNVKKQIGEIENERVKK